MTLAQVEARLKELYGEAAKGRQALAMLDKQRTQVIEQMLRVEGAITAYDEMQRSMLPVQPADESPIASPDEPVKRDL